MLGADQLTAITSRLERAGYAGARLDEESNEVVIDRGVGSDGGLILDHLLTIGKDADDGDTDFIMHAWDDVRELLGALDEAQGDVRHLLRKAKNLRQAIATHRAYWEERTANPYDDALYAALDADAECNCPVCKPTP